MPERLPRTHVFIIDGTLSRLQEGHESNAGLLYKLLRASGPSLSQTLGYHPGVQGEGWRKWLDVATGTTINQCIESGYAALASRYEPGDRIMLFGYSRGAYAVRSLCGFISRIGLLRRRHATERRVHRAFRYYQAEMLSPQAYLFSTRYCHRDVRIEVIGVWDTVRALGLPLPFLSRLAPMVSDFHDHTLGDNVVHAFQALALDETRAAYAPLPWQEKPGWPGQMKQAWFAGAHPDVGGQLGDFPAARPLGNIPLIWMLEQAEACGLILPRDWHEKFPIDPAAPMHGARRARARYFVTRRRRRAGLCDNEYEHSSVAARRVALPRYRPKARWPLAAEPGRKFWQRAVTDHGDDGIIASPAAEPLSGHGR